MNRNIAFMLLTFILTGLGVYLFMSQVVMPRELNKEPLLRESEVKGLIYTHAQQIKVLWYPVGWNPLRPAPTIPLAIKLVDNWVIRYQYGKWMAIVSGYAFVVDDKTGKVTGP